MRRFGTSIRIFACIASAAITAASASSLAASPRELREAYLQQRVALSELTTDKVRSIYLREADLRARAPGIELGINPRRGELIRLRSVYFVGLGAEVPISEIAAALGPALRI